MKDDAAPLELRDVTSGYGDVPVIRARQHDFPRTADHDDCRFERSRQIDRGQGRGRIAARLAGQRARPMA